MNNQPHTKDNILNAIGFITENKNREQEHVKYLGFVRNVSVKQNQHAD